MHDWSLFSILGGFMDLFKLEWIGIFLFFMILISIQFTLNKMVLLLKEIIHLLKIKKQ